jgi:hypothetical protein
LAQRLAAVGRRRSLAPTTARTRGRQGARHQCSTRSTPRRSSARATIRRWISLVPSQMRSDAQLAQEALGDVRAQVAAAAEHLHRAVGAAVRGLGDEQLRHRRLRVHDLRSAPQSISRATSRPSSRPAAASAAESGQRERHALVVDQPGAALLAPDRPRVASSSRRHIAPDAARRDSQSLLDEPRTLQRLAAAHAADHRVIRDLDIGEADRRMPVRIGCA